MASTHQSEEESQGSVDNSIHKQHAQRAKLSSKGLSNACEAGLNRAGPLAYKGESPLTVLPLMLLVFY